MRRRVRRQLLPLLFVLLGVFRPGDTFLKECSHYISSRNDLDESTKCLEVIRVPDVRNRNGNGLYDNCITFRKENALNGPRDDKTKNFDLLKELDIGWVGTGPNDQFERVGSYIWNDNFPVAFSPLPTDGTQRAPVYKKGRPRAPDVGAPNPYFLEVSGISLKGELLHNWLHFRVFMNRSVADANRDNLHTKAERQHHATGKITAMLLMVKDQEGYPVGDFSRELPCDKTCSKYPHPTVYGDHRNALPCSYTPPRANSHPGMFVFDADPGYYKKPPEEEPQKKTNSDRQYRLKEGVREVHATWSFNQDTCNFVTELHFYTLIFEEIYKDDSLQCHNDDKKYCKYYGWSAQYNILYPKGKSSLGAADYVDINYWKERDKRVSEIDCHVPLFDAPVTVVSPYSKGAVPSNTLDGSGRVLTATKVPRKYVHSAAISKKLGLLDTEKFQEYLGQYKIKTLCRTAALLNPEPFAEVNLKSLTSRSARTGTPTVSQFLATNEGVQCPCPAVASPEPIEQRTADPATLHGRLIHASHMALAYMLLTPLACFVARYYKETFITVFCFQEYWWYMWHVVLLITSCGFVMGAILSLYRSGRGEVATSTNLYVHKVLGYCSICVFYIEIFTGFFRRADPIKRMRQIFFHWLIGNFNIFCAVGSMFAMAFVKESGMTCGVVYTILVWTLFVVLWFALMDVHMKSTDKKLDLKPPRTYLPPPVMRLFNRDAPGRNFRMMMLGVYIVNLSIIQYLVSFYIWHSEDVDEKGEKGESCYFTWLRYYGGAVAISEADVGDDNYDQEEFDVQ